MKSIILSLAIGLVVSLSAMAQNQVVSSNQLDAETKEIYKDRISDISKEIDKIDRSILHSERIIRTRDNVVRESERQIDYIEKQEAENVAAAAKLKGEIAGHDLNALEDRIKKLNRDQNSLERSNKRDENSIIRKKAQIEKLLGEISMVEEHIAMNEQLKELEKEAQKQETQIEITDFGLLTKNEQLKELEKDRQQLKAQKNREMRKKGNAEDDIYNAETTIRALEVQRKSLADEKRSKELTLQSNGGRIQ